MTHFPIEVYRVELGAIPALSRRRPLAAYGALMPTRAWSCSGFVQLLMPGWWWGDSVASLAIVLFLIEEGREAWEEE